MLFDFNKATPQAGSRPGTGYPLQPDRGSQTRDGSATVIGYTDRIGSDAYNQKLSEQRAQTVADYLIGKGCLPARSMWRAGQELPVTGDSCTSKSKRELIVCLAPDRRVEVKVQGVSRGTAVTRRLYSP